MDVMKVARLETLFISVNKKFKKVDVRFILQACVSYFLSFFIFLPSDSPSNTVKNVFYFI